MPIKLANNASGTLATAISASDTGVALTTGNGALFPVLTAGDYFYATVTSTAGTQEIVKATARSGDSLTIVHAQEGTTAQSFAAGSRFELRVTAASVQDFVLGLDTTLRANLAASSGSSLVGYLPAGTGAVAATVQTKLRESVSVKDFGAVGDGVANDTAAIQLALNSGAKNIYAPAATYKILSTLTIPDGVSLEGDGIGATVFDGSNAVYANLTDGDHIKTAGGTLTALPALSLNVIKGQRTLTFASAPTVVTGDIINIYNPTDYSFSGFRDYYRAGEWLRVASVSGSVVTLQGTTCDAYLAANVNVYRLDSASSTHLKGFTLQGLSDPSNTVSGIYFRNAIDSSIEDVRVRGCSYIQIQLSQCFNVQLRNVTCEEDFGVTSGLDYGLGIGNSHIVSVIGGYFCAARHGITTGGNADVGAVTNRYIHISNALVSTTGVVQAMDFHGNTEYGWVDNCTIDGGFAGGGDFIKLTNNQFKGSYGNGNIAIYGAEMRGFNIDISGNTIWTDQLPTSSRSIIDFGGNSDAFSVNTYRGGVVSIKDNTILSSYPTNSGINTVMRIYNRGYVGTEKIQCYVEGNTITSLVGAQGGTVTISTVDATGLLPSWDAVTFSNNIGTGLGGLSLDHSVSTAITANTCTINGNTVSGGFGVGILATQIGKYLSVTDNVVTECRFYPMSFSGGTGTAKCRYINVANNTCIDNMTSSTSSSATNIGIRVAHANYASVQNNVTGSFNEKIVVNSNVGFVVGETITGGTSGATATVTDTRSTTDLMMERTRSVTDFTIGETVTGGTSGTTAVVTASASYTMTSRLRLDTITALQVANNNDLRLTTDSVASVTGYLSGSILKGSATYDPASLIDGAGLTASFTVAGATLGDHASASFGLDLQGITLTAWVSAADTVSVRFQNETGGTIDLGSGTVYTRVVKL